MNYSNRLNKNNNDIRLAIEKANNLPNASSGATWMRTVECEGELPEFSDWCTDKVYLNTYLSMDETNEILQRIADTMYGSDMTFAYAKNPNNPDADNVWFISLYVDREDDLMILYGSYDNIYYANRQIREDEKGYRPFDPGFIGWNSSIDLIDFGQVAPLMIDIYEAKKLFSFKPYSNAYDGYWPTAKKLYINKNKTLEEVEKLVKNIVESGSNTVAYWYYLNKYEELYCDSHSNGVYYIEYYSSVTEEDGDSHYTTELLFAAGTLPDDADWYEFKDFIGWNPNINEINMPDEDFIFYANPIIKDLFSSKPYSETTKHTIEGEYIGEPYHANSTVDMMTFIENKQIPSVITVPKEYVIEVDELPAENIDTNKLYKLPDNTPDKWIGAGIPKEGYVDTVYFNLNITADQITEIVGNIPSSSFNIMSNGSDKYLYFSYSDYSDGPYIWMEWRNFSNASFNFSGGEVDLGSSYSSFKFDSELVWVDEWGNTMDPNIVDIFKDLVSTTPFVKVEKPLIAGIYYKYDGQVWSELLNTVSVEELPKVGDPNVIYAVGEIAKESGWTGTTLPHIGYVENIYTNSQLTSEEFLKIAQTFWDAAHVDGETNRQFYLTNGGYSGYVYMYITVDDNGVVIESSCYAYRSQLFSYQDGIYTCTRPEFYFGGEFREDYSQEGAGLYNELLKSLISVTPLTEATKGTVMSPTLYKYKDGEFLTFTTNNFIISEEFPSNPLPGKVYYYNSPTDEYNGEFRDIYIKFPEDWQDDSFSSNFNNIITLREYVASKEWDNSQTVLLYYLSVDEMPTLDENGQYVFVENLSNENIIINDSEELNEKVVILVGNGDDPYMLKNMEWVPLDSYLSESTGYTMNYQQWTYSINDIYNTGYYKMYYTGDRPISWYYQNSSGRRYGGTIDGRNRGTYNGQAWGKHIPFYDYVICDNMNAYDENGNQYYEDCHTHRKYYRYDYDGSEHIYPYPVFIYDRGNEILYSFWNGSRSQETSSMIPGPFDYINYNLGQNIDGVYWRNERGSSTRGNIYIVEPPASDYSDVYLSYNGYWSKPVFLRSDTYQIYENGRYNVKDYATVDVQTSTNALTLFNISFNSPAPTDREALWIPTSNNVNYIELYKGELDIVSFNQRTIADSLNYASSSTFTSHNEKVYEAYRGSICIYDVNTGEKQSISITDDCSVNKLVIVGDYLYTIGGYDRSTYDPIDLVIKINLLDGTVTSTTGKIPAWKGGAGAVYKDGYIYMFGCTYDRWEPSNSQAIYKYDVTNESYTTLSATFDDYMSIGYSFIIDNKIYIVGGYGSPYSVYVFDPSDESLEKVFTFSGTISNITTATLYKEYILIISNRKVYCYDYKNNIMNTSSSIMYPSINGDAQFIAADGNVIYYAVDTPPNGAIITKWEEYKTTKIDSGTIKIVEDEDGIPYTLRTKQYEVKIPLKIGCILIGQGSSKPAAKAKFKIHNGTDWVEY